MPPHLLLGWTILAFLFSAYAVPAHAQSIPSIREQFARDNFRNEMEDVMRDAARDAIRQELEQRDMMRGSRSRAPSSNQSRPRIIPSTDAPCTGQEPGGVSCNCSGRERRDTLCFTPVPIDPERLRQNGALVPLRQR